MIGHAATCLCRLCITEQATASRAAQGLPPTIEDEKVLRHLTRISVPVEAEDVAS